MSRLFYCFVFISFLFYTCVVKAEIPIIAFPGVPAEESTEYRFREFKKAGFDVSISNFEDKPTSQFIQALDKAHACGVRLMALSAELWNQPVPTVNKIKNHPALFGYFLRDEPSTTDEINATSTLYRKISSVDKTKPFYMCMIPCYGQMSKREYEGYVNKLVKIGVPQICFDYYPITESGLRPLWFYNLEFVRKQSLRTKRPFWGYVLSTAHADYPIPTLGMLRLQVYANLMYGAQAILYFTYWTPHADENFHFRYGPIASDGTKTTTYDTVSLMNRELRNIRQLFDGATVRHLGHLVKIPEGARKFSLSGSGLKRIVASGRKGILVSRFSSSRGNYIAFLNKDYENEAEIQIVALGKVNRITKDLKSEPLQSHYRLSPGNILILQIH
ncbi:MAG: hypothetical protein Q3994_04530 [Prevotella sp.]|nr:hypothetical protein [Prevotella sp.]